VSTSDQHVVVIGGGVVGAMCAYYLARRGFQITIVERGEFGHACSFGNCGFVCPSHVLPLQAPGAIGKSLRMMFRRNSPFTIKPSLSPSFWSWCWGFARRCNREDMLKTGHARHALLESSLRLYRELVDREGLDCEWQDKGLLLVFRSQNEFEEFGETNHLMLEHYGVGATPYDGGQLVELEPALRTGLAGGWHFECDSHLRPDRLMQELKRVLEGMNTRILERCEFKSFESESGQAVAINTSQGVVQADHFVLAGGAWTPRLMKDLGCRIAVQPGKGYSLTTTEAHERPQIPMIFEQDRVAVTPFEQGLRVGSTMELSGYDTSVKAHRLKPLQVAERFYLNQIDWDVVTLRHWWGWRPMSHDGKPYIDRSPRLPNVVIAAGHGMLGLSMATATGKLVSEVLSAEHPHLNVEPYAVDERRRRHA
jgi:D-amino-acid dehydrogenase